MTYGELPVGLFFQVNGVKLQKMEHCAVTMDMKIALLPPELPVAFDGDEVYSCFNCGYLGNRCRVLQNHEDGQWEECPDCGCHAGNGFGFACNDPRYAGI